MGIRPPQPTDADVLRLWLEHWYVVVCDERGGIDPIKVARELYDYSSLMENTSAVFSDITMGRIAKPNTLASDVLAVHNEVCHKYCTE